MRLITAVTMMAVTVLSAFTSASAQKAIPASRPAGAILDQIPAGTMGFFVVNDVRSSTAQVDKFLERIGQKEAAFKTKEVGGLLELIRKNAKLGEGFNANGGFAVVVLDLQQFGININTMMAGRDEKGKKVDPPIVFVIPGASIDSVLQCERLTSEGAKHVVVKIFDIAPAFAAESNGYVLLSPREDALDAIIQAKKKASDELSAEQSKTILQSAGALYVNMKVAGPIIIKFLKQMEDMMTAMQAMSGGQGGPQMAKMNMMGQVLSFYRDLIGQMDSVLVTARFTDVGPALAVRVAMAKDSEMGKVVARVKPLKTSNLSRLPNLDYIFAMEAAGSTENEARIKTANEQMDKFSGIMGDVPEATKTRLKTWNTEWCKQVEGVQFVFGGAPKGKGAMAMAMVIDCKDSQKTKDLLAEGVDLFSEVWLKKMLEMADMFKPQTRESVPGAITTGFDNTGVSGSAPLRAPAPTALVEEPTSNPTSGTAPATKPAIDIKVSYKKTVETADNINVDAIVVSSPILVPHQKDLMKYFGDEQLRMFVAAPTDKLVVMTFGGGSDMMPLAIKTAVNKSGDILGKQSQAVLDQLPKDRAFLGLFDLANAITLGKKLKPEGAPDDFTNHLPAALTVGVSDSTIEYTVLVPDAMIKELVTAIQKDSKPRASTRPHTVSPQNPSGTTPVPENPKKQHEDL